VKKWHEHIPESPKFQMWIRGVVLSNLEGWQVSKSMLFQKGMGFVGQKWSIAVGIRWYKSNFWMN